MREIRQLQEQRVLAFRQLEEGFSAMCKAQNFEGFAALTGTITRTFAELSASINSKEAGLREVGQRATADIVRQLQEGEGAKLQLVAHLLIKRQRLQALRSKVAASRGDASAQLSDDMDALDALENEVAKARTDVAVHEAGISEKLEELLSIEYDARDDISESDASD